MAINFMMGLHSGPIWKGFQQKAIGFRAAADRLQQELDIPAQPCTSADAQTADTDFSIAIPVLRGFATECALKALTKRSTGGYERNHNLVELYGALPANVKRMIETSALNDGTLPPLEVLKRHRKDFDAWRYPPPKIKPVNSNPVDHKSLDSKPLITNLRDLPKVLDLLIRTLNLEEFIALCPQDDNGGEPPPADHA